MTPTISIIFAFLFCHLACQALGDDSCVVTDTSCPCSVAASAGVCMQHKGDNKCLMTACSEGHKCDCLGYEQCAIKSCSKCTTAAGVIPSTETPFSCQSVEGIATCLSVTGFRNGTGATEAAKLGSSQIVKLINTEVIASQTESLIIQENKIKIDALIERLDYHNITTSERGDIIEHALVVGKAIASAEREIAALQGSAEVNGLAGVSQSDLASSNCTSSQCKSLISQIEELEIQRAVAVLKAGEMAQKTRETKNGTTEIKIYIVKIREEAVEALKTAESHPIDIFARIRSADVAVAKK